MSGEHWAYNFLPVEHNKHSPESESGLFDRQSTEALEQLPLPLSWRRLIVRPLRNHLPEGRVQRATLPTLANLANTINHTSRPRRRLLLLHLLLICIRTCAHTPVCCFATRTGRRDQAGRSKQSRVVLPIGWPRKAC